MVLIIGTFYIDNTIIYGKRAQNSCTKMGLYASQGLSFSLLTILFDVRTIFISFLNREFSMFKYNAVSFVLPKNNEKGEKAKEHNYNRFDSESFYFAQKIQNTRTITDSMINLEYHCENHCLTCGYDQWMLRTREIIILQSRTRIFRTNKKSRNKSYY